jgi:hypothetical protein
MAQQLINIGSSPNDGSGDSLRTAFGKINTNFTELYKSASQTGNVYTIGNIAGQILFQTPISAFTEATFVVHSYETTGANSQAVNITSSINNDGSIKFAAYGTTFSGGAVTNYSMDVASGNVRLLANPISTDVVRHLIVSNVVWIGAAPIGLDIQLDGYAVGNLLTTELSLNLSTQS